jgi:hypothetical protein
MAWVRVERARSVYITREMVIACRCGPLRSKPWNTPGGRTIGENEFRFQLTSKLSWWLVSVNWHEFWGYISTCEFPDNERNKKWSYPIYGLDSSRTSSSVIDLQSSRTFIGCRCPPWTTKPFPSSSILVKVGSVYWARFVRKKRTYEEKEWVWVEVDIEVELVSFSQLIRSAPVQDIEFPEEKVVINEELSLWVISTPVSCPATKGIKIQQKRGSMAWAQVERAPPS